MWVQKQLLYKQNPLNFGVETYLNNYTNINMMDSSYPHVNSIFFRHKFYYKSA